MTYVSLNNGKETKETYCNLTLYIFLSILKYFSNFQNENFQFYD